MINENFKNKKPAYDFCWIIKGNSIKLKGKRKYRQYLVNCYYHKNESGNSVH